MQECWGPRVKSEALDNGQLGKLGRLTKVIVTSHPKRKVACHKCRPLQSQKLALREEEEAYAIFLTKQRSTYVGGSSPSQNSTWISSASAGVSSRMVARLGATSPTSNTQTASRSSNVSR